MNCDEDDQDYVDDVDDEGGDEEEGVQQLWPC